jgi:hypothetical protein
MVRHVVMAMDTAMTIVIGGIAKTAEILSVSVIVLKKNVVILSASVGSKKILTHHLLLHVHVKSAHQVSHLVSRSVLLKNDAVAVKI